MIPADPSQPYEVVFEDGTNRPVLAWNSDREPLIAGIHQLITPSRAYRLGHRPQSILSAAPIPAAPGWYLEETSEDGSGETDFIPVIAWQPGTHPNDPEEQLLLPYVDGGAGYPPFAHTVDSMTACGRRVVYLPNYDPADHGPARYRPPVF
ncbi:hypothetical protein ABZ690_00855 [Streptomyces sp. NPDC006967]|uniref:hypothetical protein n=1 Tax=Streptomyces sp. NPDC006967 TaxID=3156906 RepID=UPI0033D6EB48